MPKSKLSIIEDSEDVRELLTDDLQDSFDVKNYSSAQKCLDDIAELGLPDVFVTDFKMPGLSGLEFVEILNDRGIEVPVIMVSGAADKEVALEALKLGIYGFIEKPYVVAELKNMAKNAITKAKSLQLNNSILTEFNRFLRYVDDWLEVSVTHVLHLEKKLFDNNIVADSQKEASQEMKVRNLMKQAEKTVAGAKQEAQKMLAEYNEITEASKAS